MWLCYNYISFLSGPWVWWRKTLCIMKVHTYIHLTISWYMVMKWPKVRHMRMCIRECENKSDGQMFIEETKCGMSQLIPKMWRIRYPKGCIFIKETKVDNSIDKTPSFYEVWRVFKSKSIGTFTYSRKNGLASMELIDEDFAWRPEVRIMCNKGYSIENNTKKQDWTNFNPKPASLSNARFAI